jgi:hypothetical protein
MTNFSDLTATSIGIDEELCATYASQYVQHKRGIPVNRRQWNPKFNHDPSSISSPIFPPAARVPPQMCDTSDIDIVNLPFNQVLLPKGLYLLKEVMATTSNENKCLIQDVMRSLVSAGRMTAYDTMSKRRFNIVQDSAAWSLSRSQPVVGKRDLYQSQVPLGTILNRERSLPPRMFAEMLSQQGL